MSKGQQIMLQMKSEGNQTDEVLAFIQSALFHSVLSQFILHSFSTVLNGNNGLLQVAMGNNSSA